ncbi:MAG: hypothetical protein HY231_22650 [Acidobacteria bacterium]|nr:hypothetical protein [Acidobacteriota bacterium]
MNFLFSLVIGVMVLALPPQKVVDQILTLVNDEPITRTDLLWSLAMDAKAPNPANGVSTDLLRQKLDVMIDEKIVAQEALRIPTAEITPTEIEAKHKALMATFPTAEAFRQRLEGVGLTAEKLDELLRRRIIIEKYITFRFQSFILVSDQEIQEYYDRTLAPQMKEKGAVPPPLAEVSEMIRARVKSNKIEAELETWLTSARQRAEIISLVEP